MPGGRPGALSQVTEGGVTPPSACGIASPYKHWPHLQFAGAARVCNQSGDQTRPGTAYPFRYGYNLIGEINSMTMPLGRKVTPKYDALSGEHGSASPTYVNSISCARHEDVTQMALGSMLTEQKTKDSATGSNTRSCKRWTLEAVTRRSRRIAGDE